MAISSVGASFLQSATTSGGNWLQDVATATADNADWMSPSNGPSAMELAANAFAAAQQIRMSNVSSLAVRQGISVLSAQLTGNSVNRLA